MQFTNEPRTPFRATPDEAKAFGSHWCFRDEFFEYAKETLVATYENETGEGHPVEVYCTAMPTRFYRIDAGITRDANGWPVDGFSISTGGGMAALTHQVAIAITRGLLTVEPD